MVIAVRSPARPRPSRPASDRAPARLAIRWISLLVLLLAFAPAPLASAASKPLFLTSFLPVHSVTAAIAGDAAEVRNWLPQGVDPHDFQFSPRDLRRLREASVLVVCGLGLEGWKEAKLRDVANHPSLRIVEAAADLPKDALIADAEPHRHDHADDHDHDHAEAPNPHFWLDPVLMTHAARRIGRALGEADPSNAAVYARNTESVVASLEALHAEYSRALAGATNAFITYHAAFPYLARRYGLRLVGVVETGAADQPTARRLADLGRLVRAEGVRVLFVDGNPPRIAKQIASDLRLGVASLSTLETGTFAPGAYEQGMRRNLDVLKSALLPAARP
ncbi:MAG: zinc ABC transporter substrate-binding protein [Verrucomicrobiales bacterium]|nr:zinc ABC transporter substrate-binding protein [Verrucomicrobiales bacterium]